MTELPPWERRQACYDDELAIAKAVAGPEGETDG